MGIDLVCAITIIHEIYKICMAVISLCYNISAWNFAAIVILERSFQLWT